MCDGGGGWGCLARALALLPACPGLTPAGPACLTSAATLLPAGPLLPAHWPSSAPARAPLSRRHQDAFYRQGLPNIMQLLATVAIFLMVVYFQVGQCGWWGVLVVVLSDGRWS